MKLMVQVTLLPDEANEAALRETPRLCKIRANHASPSPPTAPSTPVSI
ncbi:hypothetical protein OG417_07145 [Actinoallomurus sp. NBC_01490]|nr:hypothetical protein [Actinoallomurus sp. NBC_01490]